MRHARVLCLASMLFLMFCLSLAACNAGPGTGGAPAPCAAACETTTATGAAGQPAHTPAGGLEPADTPGETFPHPTASATATTGRGLSAEPANPLEYQTTVGVTGPSVR